MSDKETDNDAPAPNIESEPTAEDAVSSTEAAPSSSDETAKATPTEPASEISKTEVEDQPAPEESQISTTAAENVEENAKHGLPNEDKSTPDQPKTKDDELNEEKIQSKPEEENVAQDAPTEEPPKSESAPSPAPAETVTKTPERRESNAEELAEPSKKSEDQPDTVPSSVIEADVVERKKSNVSEKDTSDGATIKHPVEPSNENDASDDIQNMIKELADPAENVVPKDTDKSQSGKETTENLLSVLEDEAEGQAKEKPSTSEPPTAESSPSTAPKEEPTDTTSTEGAVKPTKPKKYLYKLKSKTGKILHYTSTVPITLKRPVIHLTKMEDTSKPSNPLRKVIDLEKDDVDSDNSTKENNVKENEAPNDNVIRTIRKKGRPPSSSKIPPVITLDGNASDTGEDFRNKNAPSFSMQTRKRQLKFLPDGRLITPEKRVKTDDQKGESSDSDVDIISSEGENTDSSAKKLLPKKVETPLTKKFQPPPKPNNSVGERRKYKKVFDFESYYREKTGIAPPANLIRAQGGKPFTSLTPIRKLVDTPRPKPIAPNSLAPKKTSSVDPAQLLSSLIGVPITASQLNIVKFKPKIIQERTNNVVTSTPKKVTFEDEKHKTFASANQSELLKSTPFKIVSKPTYQKILPKPAPMDKTPTRMAFQPVSVDNKYSTPSTLLSTTSPYLRESLSETLSKFDNFSDSKVVKTKEGPKKAVKRKYPVEDGTLKDSSCKTIYDLMYEIFDKMPSWNLHVIPDTNYFCLAQVSRGRMGIPTLKKSIELNSEFFAKVYVHQLHCKRYDGVYDTESKIIKLIKEIDALAA